MYWRVSDRKTVLTRPRVSGDGFQECLESPLVIQNICGEKNSRKDQRTALVTMTRRGRQKSCQTLADMASPLYDLPSTWRTQKAAVPVRVHVTKAHWKVYLHRLTTLRIQNHLVETMNWLLWSYHREIRLLFEQGQQQHLLKWGKLCKHSDNPAFMAFKVNQKCRTGSTPRSFPPLPWKLQKLGSDSAATALDSIWFSWHFQIYAKQICMSRGKEGPKSFYSHLSCLWSEHWL